MDNELEQRLENSYSAVLEILRGGWDVHQSNHLALSLFFFKRLLALIVEKKISFLSLHNDTLYFVEQLRHQSVANPSETTAVFEQVLQELMWQNKPLAAIFDPLALALQQKGGQLWQALETLQGIDLSISQFPIGNFGSFFSAALYQSSIRTGKHLQEGNLPAFLCRLIIALCKPKRGEILYSPAVGQGDLWVHFSRSAPKLQFVGQEADLRLWGLAQMNLWANGIYDSLLYHQNGLLETPYELLPADIAFGNCLLQTDLDPKQFQQTDYIVSPFDWSKQQQLDSNSLTVQRILYQLSKQGRALLIFPLQATYKDRADRKLREFLIRKNYVETVVALPAGLLPNINSPLALMLISKQRSQEQQQILFINASMVETTQKGKLNKILSAETIQQIALLAEQKGYIDDFWDKHSAWVTNTQIAFNQYNLNPKQYASPFIKKLEELATSEQLKPINELLAKELAFLWISQEDIPNRNLRYIGVADLATTFGDYLLDFERLRFMPEMEHQEGRLLNEAALLVYAEGKKLRLGYFEPKNEPVVVDKDILIFAVDTKLVSVEYLLLQLYSGWFGEQLQLYKSDHPESPISEREFAHLQIIVGSPEEQQKQVQSTKIALLREEEKKVENLRYKLNVGKQKAQSEQYKIISSLQHELGNRLPAILTEFKNLKDFLLDKCEYEEPISLYEPIFPVFEGEDASSVDNLSVVLQRIEHLLKHTVSAIDNTGNIIKADKSKLNLEKVDIKDFLREVALLYANETLFTVEIEVEKDPQGQELSIFCPVDRAQLSTAFINLIENAKRHGFVQDRKYTVRFQLSLSADEQEAIIEYENDGKPFPSSFSFDDFVSYGNYAGQTGHSGIGGFLIYQIIDNHEGSLLLRDNIPRNDPFKVQFEIALPLWGG